MFTVGQRVWHRDGRRSGKVIEVDRNRVYVEQDNGAELDFPASELSATPPAGAAEARPKGVAGATQPVPNRRLVAADITPEHARVLGLVPVRTVQAVALLFEKRPGAGRFQALDVAGKLNVIAEITGVPYRTMREYSDRPGEMGLLMGKGLADSQRDASGGKGTR